VVVGSSGSVENKKKQQETELALVSDQKKSERLPLLDNQVILGQESQQETTEKRSDKFHLDIHHFSAAQSQLTVLIGEIGSG